MANSNYYSTGSIFLNPTASVDSKTYMQANFVGVNFWFYNNLAYLPWFSVWRLRRHPGEIQMPELSTMKTKKFLYANTVVDGPAFVISKRNYGAGLFARARAVVDVRGLPYELVDLYLNPDNVKRPESGDFNLRNVKAASMSWVEFGANFGMMVKSQRKDLWIVGGNAKYITGLNIFYANLQRLKGFYNDTMAQLDELSGKLRYNLPGWNTGRGYALDLAVTFKRMLKSSDNYLPHSKQNNCTTIDYKYRATLALRDAGYIRFTKGGTRSDLNASGTINPTQDKTQSSIETRLNLTTAAGNVLAAMPANLLAQFDWNFENHIYLNATAVKSLLPHRVVGVKSPDYLSICPRFELRQFEVGLPVTFQKYLYPQVGLALRYRTFVLGFDNMFPLFFMKPRTYGLGVNFSLGVSLFRNPACRVRQGVADCPPNNMSGIKKKKNKAWWKFWKRKRGRG